MKIKTLMLCLSFSFSQFTFAKNHPLKFCYEDQDSYPWVLKDGSGLNITLLKILAKKLNTEVTLSPVPWKRCLEGLKNGKIFDGAFAASYKVDRLEFGRYPTLDEKADGKPNENKRLHINEYSLYVLKEDNSIKWDGKQITGVQIIGSLPGYSINDFLIKLKLRVDDGTRLPSGVFEKLVGKRFAAVAMQDYRGDWKRKLTI